MASSHVADNPFHADCLKVLEKLRGAGGQLPHSVLLKRMKVNSRDFQGIIDTLVQQGDVVRDVVTTKGRPLAVYRLASGEGRVNDG